MDDQFFAKLREIQKKERANSSLARVGNDFYKRTHRYLDSIRDVARNDPFSEESDLLKNVQRIATEICEIREHKISDAAVMNIHRSYHLFQGKPQFDLVDTTPLNITDEEETLYFSFIDVLKNHRRGISLDQLTNDELIDVSNDNKIDVGSDSLHNDSNNTSKNNIVENDSNNEQILNRLNEIKSGKVIEDEPFESIEKQINKSKYSKTNDNFENVEKNEYNHIESRKKHQKQSSTEQQKKQQREQQRGQQKKQAREQKRESQKEPSLNSKDKKTNNKNNNFNSNNSASAKITSNSVFNSVSPVNGTSASFDLNAQGTAINNENNALKQKSNLSNIIGDENDQFIDLNHLDPLGHDNDHYNLNDNTLNRTDSKSTVDRITNVMVLVFSEINSIIGVDKKVYGPFHPQDIVIMPDINAAILIKNKKGRLVKV